MRKLTFTLYCLPLLASSCGGSEEAGDRAQTIASLSGDASAGQATYSMSCSMCHGADGSGVTGLGSDLTATSLTDAEIAQTFLTPPGGMNSFAGSDDQTLANIITYVRTL